MNAKLSHWAACHALVLCCAAAGAEPTSRPIDGYLRYTGTASVGHSSAFLYGEYHVLHYRGGQLMERVVLYTCSDGSAFARKSVSYVDPLAPDFLLEDSGNGMREGIRTEPGGRVVFFRLHRTETEKSGPLPRVSGLVADTGFDEFVRSNWQRLLGADTLPIRFLVPSRLEDFGFQVQHLRSQTLGDTPTQVFRLRLAGLSGWLLRGIDVYYSSAEHLLIRYDGLSDLLDATGEPFRTEISFPPGARGAASEQDLLAARATPLRRCD